MFLTVPCFIHLPWPSSGVGRTLCAAGSRGCARLASAGHVGWPLQGLQDAVLRAVEPWRPAPVDGGGWPC